MTYSASRPSGNLVAPGERANRGGSVKHARASRSDPRRTERRGPRGPVHGHAGRSPAFAAAATPRARLASMGGSQVRRHAVYPVLLEDPFVRHSAERPRGYPGDAELLDYIYESGNVRPMVESASRSGPPSLRLHSRRARARGRAAPAGPRGRGDRPPGRRSGSRPHMLSVACGHLREAPGARIPARRHVGPLRRARPGPAVARARAP